jgi:PPM family protein phosphatase
VTDAQSPADGPGAPLMASAAGRSHRGAVRRENQDRFHLGPLGAGHGPRWSAPERREVGAAPAPDDEVSSSASMPPLSVPDCGLLLVVVDGMGGPAGGSEAASIATRVLDEVLARGWSGRDCQAGGGAFAEHLERAASEAHAAIRRAASLDSRLRGMGTTLTAAGLVRRELHLLQVGDSRAYLFRNGGLEQLTRDQSMVQEMLDSGVMTPDQARNSPHRNVILQALGVEGPIEPVASLRSLEPGDRVLLCTDGLSGVLSTGRIEEILGSEDSAEAACDALVEATLQAGAPDNVTCVVADLS